jgi:hypothetical protein
MSGIVAGSAAAVALYYYFKAGGSMVAVGGDHTPETAYRNVEHAPNSWTEALTHVTEMFRYVMNDTLGRSVVGLSECPSTWELGGVWGYWCEDTLHCNCYFGQVALCGPFRGPRLPVS